MKKGSFLILTWLLLNFSVVVYSQAPIEVIYLIPSDQREVSGKSEILLEIVSDVQVFYADEMERHGFKRKTFEYEKNIRVHKSIYTLKEYLSDRNKVWFELGPDSLYTGRFRNENTGHIVFMEGTNRLEGTVVGKSLFLRWGPNGKPGGIEFGYCLAWLPAAETDYLDWVLAHELGHGFGLKHPDNPFVEGKLHIMGENNLRTDVQDLAFTLDDARILDTSPFLSMDDFPTLTKIDLDVNNDGHIDLADVLVVRSAIKGSSLYHTDVNNDGVTDEVDLMLVKAAAHEAIAMAAPPRIQRKGSLSTKWADLKRR